MQNSLLPTSFFKLISDLFYGYDKRIILTCPAVKQDIQSIFLLQILVIFQTLISPSRWSESVSNIIGYKSGVSYSLTHWKDRCTFLFSLFSRGPEFLWNYYDNTCPLWSENEKKKSIDTFSPCPDPHSDEALASNYEILNGLSSAIDTCVLERVL